MKIYKPKKWLTYLRIFSLIFFIFLISTSELNKTTISVTKNENLDKAISYDIITDQQYALYKESLYEPVSSFIGELTGYAGDCPLCSGIVACKRINVLKEGIIYNDSEYGEVRMVASSKKYPCGTILRFNVSKISSEPIIGIVIDRGVRGNVIDLLVESENQAKKKVGRVRKLEFEILRLGW